MNSQIASTNKQIDQDDKAAAISLVIVEDHCMTRAGLSLILSNFNDLRILASVGDADNGLRLCKDLKPDVVILDLHLPGGSGPRSTVESFCTECPESSVLVYSAESRMAFVQAVLKAGARGYLLKSEPPERLVAAVRKLAHKQVDFPILSRELFEDQKKFSKAEQHILRLLANGMKYKEISEERETTISTVRAQCDFLLLRLELKTREELIAWAVKNGFGSL